MSLEIRYGTQSACADLPSALRPCAIVIGLGGGTLGCRARAVRLLAHIDCTRSSRASKKAAEAGPRRPHDAEGSIIRRGVVAGIGRWNAGLQGIHRRS